MSGNFQLGLKDSDLKIADDQRSEEYQIFEGRQNSRIHLKTDGIACPYDYHKGNLCMVSPVRRIAQRTRPLHELCSEVEGPLETLEGPLYLD